MKKRLYRSNTDCKLAGVCGGIGEYFDIDPTLVRLAWVLFTCLGGSGLVAYIIAAIVIPQRPTCIEGENTNHKEKERIQSCWILRKSRKIPMP